MDKKTWHAHIKKQKLKINVALFRKKKQRKKHQEQIGVIFLFQMHTYRALLTLKSVQR